MNRLKVACERTIRTIETELTRIESAIMKGNPRGVHERYNLIVFLIGTVQFQLRRYSVFGALTELSF